MGRARKSPKGEPSRECPSYTPELAAEICRRMAEGESLNQICRDKENIPVAASTVRYWSVMDFNGFAAQYARAREALLDHYEDEQVEIADDGRNDWEERETRGGSYVALNKEAVERSKLRVDTRKWLLAKLRPKKFGDKVDVSAKHEAGDSFKKLWGMIGGQDEPSD